MANRDGAIYALIRYHAGEVISRKETTSLCVAKAEYKAIFEATGTAPRLFIDGERTTSREADRIMGLGKWGSVGPMDWVDEKAKRKGGVASG